MSDDEDSDDDDAGNDAQTVNHISVTAHVNSDRQERVNQANGDIINHILINKHTNERRQEMDYLATETNVTPEGRTQIILSATIGITSTEVEQIARGHAFDKEDRRRTAQKSNKTKKYEPSYATKKYTEGTIHTNVDYMREHEPMKDFTIQDQVEHVLGVALAQVYSLKRGLKEFGQEGKNAVQSELQQHHDMETYFPIHPKELTRQHKREALDS